MTRFFRNSTDLEIDQILSLRIRKRWSKNFDSYLHSYTIYRDIASFKDLKDKSKIMNGMIRYNYEHLIRIYIFIKR